MNKEQIHEAIQSSANQEDDDLKDAVLVKWVLVADFMNPKGERVLIRSWAENMIKYEVEGLLRYGHSSNWR